VSCRVAHAATETRKGSVDVMTQSEVVNGQEGEIEPGEGVEERVEKTVRKLVLSLCYKGGAQTCICQVIE